MASINEVSGYESHLYTFTQSLHLDFLNPDKTYLSPKDGIVKQKEP